MGYLQASNGIDSKSNVLVTGSIFALGNVTAIGTISGSIISSSGDIVAQDDIFAKNMDLSARLLKQYGKGEEHVIGVIPELIRERFPKFITLGRSASYKVKEWELGQHGDYGANGSRGSLLQFRKLNTKIVVGHYHSPGRKDGALAVGTSTRLRVGYNNGPSSWLQSHVIIHKDGRAQHVNFINGKYTSLK